MKRFAGLGWVVVLGSLATPGAAYAACEAWQYESGKLIAARQELDKSRAEVVASMENAGEDGLTEKMVLVFTYETLLRSLDQSNVVLNMLAAYESRKEDPEARQLLDEMINWAAGSYRRSAEVQLDTLTSMAGITENHGAQVTAARDRVARWSQSLACERPRAR
jgi:hypothetical protein